MIAMSGKPVARLVPVKDKKKVRRPGTARGKIILAESFAAPLPDVLLDAFEVKAPRT